VAAAKRVFAKASSEFEAAGCVLDDLEFEQIAICVGQASDLMGKAVKVFLPCLLCNMYLQYGERFLLAVFAKKAYLGVGRLLHIKL